MTATKVTLRPATPQDAEFFGAVYASTREEELAQTGWNAEQKAQFCAMQFAAQSAHYAQHHSDAEVSVIEHDGKPAGRLFISRNTEEISIVDISLLPEYRGAGIGTQLLRELQEEARSAGLPLGIYVEKFNPAQRLYRRLGFVECGDEGVYWRMSWRES